MSTFSDSLGLARLGGDFWDGRERRKRRRVNLLDDDPGALDALIRERVKAAPPETLGGRAVDALQYGLEILDLPRNAIANLINLGVGAESSSKTKGVLGLPKITSRDLLDKAGLSAGDSTGGKVVDFLAGFLGDVATDPLTYLTGGTSTVFGTAGRAIGGKVLTKAAAKTAEERVAAALAKRAANTARVANPAHAADAALERIGRRSVAKGLGRKVDNELGADVLGGGAEYFGKRGRQALLERSARKLVRETPGALDQNLLGVSTRGMREFNPLSLPAWLGTATTSLVAPELGGKLARGWERAEPAIRKVLNPLSLLPEADKTLLTTERGTAIAKSLGLDRLARGAAALPGVKQLGTRISEAGRAIREKLSTEPLPPRAGDPDDLQRYEAEMLSRGMSAHTAKTGRQRAVDEFEWMSKALQEAANGLDTRATIDGLQTRPTEQTRPTPELLNKLVPSLVELTRSIERGKSAKSELADEVRKLIAGEKGPPELAERVAKFIGGGGLETRPTLPTLDDLAQPYSDTLRHMLRIVGKDLPTHAGTPEIRKALLERFKPRDVEAAMQAPLATRAGREELQDAIDGWRRYKQVAAEASARGGAVGGDFKPGDRVLIPGAGEATVEIVDARNLTARLKADKSGDKISFAEADDYPLPLRDDRDLGRALKTAAAVYERPHVDLLADVTDDAGLGAPLVGVYGGRGVAIRGGAALAGMQAWGKDRWKTWRKQIADKYGAAAVEGIEQPVVIRRLGGEPVPAVNVQPDAGPLLQAAQERVKFGEAELAKWRREKAYTKKTPAMVLEADTRLQDLLGEVKTARTQVNAIKTRAEKAAERAGIAARAARGELTDAVIREAPLETLPDPVARLLQKEALAQIENTDSPATLAALQKISGLPGGKVAAGVVAAQRERLAKILSGETDQRTVWEKQLGAPQRPASELFKMFRAPADKRAQWIEQSLASIDAGQPDEIARELDDLLAPGLGNPGNAGGLETRPTALDPQALKAQLEHFHPTRGWAGVVDASAGGADLEWIAAATRSKADSELSWARAELAGLGHRSALDAPTDAAKLPGWMVSRLAPKRAKDLLDDPAEMEKKLHALEVLRAAQTNAGNRLEADTTLLPGQSEIAAGIRTPGPAGVLAVDDPLRAIVRSLEQKENARLDMQNAAGVAAPELSTERGLGYMERMIEKPKTALGTWFRKTSMSTKASFQKARQAFREETTFAANRDIDLVNDWLAGKAGSEDARAMRIAEDLGLKAGEQIDRYELNGLLSHIHREIETVRTVGSADFFKEMAKTLGVRVGDGPAPGGYRLVSRPELGDIGREFAFPMEAAGVIDKHFDQWKKADQVLGSYDKLLGIWKGWALVAPAYHLRNLWGGVWNAHLVDGWSPTAFADMRKLQQSIATGNGLQSKIDGLNLTRGELWRKLSVDAGLTGRGLFGREIKPGTEASREIIEGLQSPVSMKTALQNLKDGSPLKANALLGQLGEDALRGSVVIARMRKGDSFETAVAAAKKALFDYAELTDYDRAIKRVIPFWSWTKNNSKLLAMMALTRPEKLALVPKIQQNLEHVLAGDERLPPSLRPAHVLKEGGVQISGGAKPDFFNLGYYLPIGELRNINPLQPGAAVQSLVDAAGGPAKTLGELGTNYDTFFERPIREYPEQTKDFLGVPMAPELKHLLRTIRPLNQVEQGVRNVEASETAAGGLGKTAAQSFGARLFPVDTARQLFDRERRINEQIGAVKRDLRRRLRDVRGAGGDPLADAEFGRLVAVHEELRGERETLPTQGLRGRSRQEKLETFLELNRLRESATP